MYKGERCNVLVTRPRHQADSLCFLLEQQGFNAVRFPTLEIVALETTSVSQQLKKLNQYQWLIFISANAVNFALSANDGRIESFSAAPIAAVGRATEKALLAAGLKVDLLPVADFNSEGLLATSEMHQVRDKSCLIVRGQGGRETLADSLRERGAKVGYLEVYARVEPQTDHSQVESMLARGDLDLITITSADALKNLLSMIDKSLHEKLLKVPLVVMSQRIKAVAESYKFKHIAVTEYPADTAIIETVMKTQMTGAEY